MKLKLGQIHDQISAIDKKMAKESIKYREAAEKHENFQKLFEEFLGKQFDRVKQKLLELDGHETESDQLKEKLADLRQIITVKSLHIYELEQSWRQHKTCQLFLSHLGTLLKDKDNDDTLSEAILPVSASIAESSAAESCVAGPPTEATSVADSSAAAHFVPNSPAASSLTDSPVGISPVTNISISADADSASRTIPQSPFNGTAPDFLTAQPNFNVDPACDTPSLDDLISNFQLHDHQEELFDEEQYAHVTPTRVVDFLDKLKQQNIRLLRHKLEYEKVTNILQEAEKVCYADAEDQATKLAQQVAEVQDKLEAETLEVEKAEQCLEEAVQQGCRFAGADVEALKKFVESLYERIFKPTYEERSHVHMAKCVEQYVESLLCQLYSYEPQILKKVLKRK